MVPRTPLALVFTLLAPLLAPRDAHAQPAMCRTAIAPVERVAGVPDRLMQAMAIMESGRRDDAGVVSAWPWTINVEGVGEWFDTKQQAIAAVTAHRARGARSIDVGCMQVNLMHHPDAFATLDEAFDPTANARYAAKFLQQLLAQTGSWPLAVGGYHSLTPDIGGDYAKKVLAIWARPDPARDPARAPTRQAATLQALNRPPDPLATPVAPPAALPPGGRVLASPGSTIPQFTGRGLDSYRSIPTRLANSTLFRRS